MNITEDNIERWLQGCKLYSYEKNQLIQQILEIQENAEKWTKYGNSYYSLKEKYVDLQNKFDSKTLELEKENKRLKESNKLFLHDQKKHIKLIEGQAARIQQLLATKEGNCPQ